MMKNKFLQGHTQRTLGYLIQCYGGGGGGVCFGNADKLNVRDPLRSQTDENLEIQVREIRLCFSTTTHMLDNTY
jgi:hypothetical protein